MTLGRMFGALLGHLSKAQREESTRQDSELKRQSALKKVDERVKAFRQEIRAKEFQDRQKRKAQDRRLIDTIQVSFMLGVKREGEQENRQGPWLETDCDC